MSFVLTLSELNKLRKERSFSRDIVIGFRKLFGRRLVCPTLPSLMEALEKIQKEFPDKYNDGFSALQRYEVGWHVLSEVFREHWSSVMDRAFNDYTDERREIDLKFFAFENSREERENKISDLRSAIRYLRSTNEDHPLISTIEAEIVQIQNEPHPTYDEIVQARKEHAEAHTALRIKRGKVSDETLAKLLWAQRVLTAENGAV